MKFVTDKIKYYNVLEILIFILSKKLEKYESNYHSKKNNYKSRKNKIHDDNDDDDDDEVIYNKYPSYSHISEKYCFILLLHFLQYVGYLL